MIALTNAKIITVTNGVIEKGTILVEDEKIVALGDVEIPEGAEIIDVEGKWVTPGLIDAHTHISTFNEPQTMPGSYDGNEITNPNTSFVRGIDALNPFDMGISAAREAGFTTCYTGPGSANVIGGTGISFKCKQGKTVHDIAIPNSEMMKMALGENPKRCYGPNKLMPMTRMGTGAVLREALFNAKVYSDELLEAQKDPSKKVKPDFKLESLVPVVRKEMKCRIHCHQADDIVTAIRIAEEFDLDYSIEHCTEGYKILDFLKEKNVTAVVGPLLMGPMKMEIWGCRQDTPAKMEAAGIDFCLTADDSSATKWLPVHVGIAMRNGLSFEMAMESVTIRPAKLLGLADRLGSLEVGKDADLAIFDGMPFSNLTSCVATMIDGKFEFKNL